jgi:Zn-finger nucleic acid-binding protein
MTTRLGVEIDYCPSCRGVWLDRGELDKLLARSDHDEDGDHDRDDRRLRRDGEPETQRRRPWWTDLFD